MTTIDLSTDAPPSPERTLALAEMIAEAVRALNHATRHHEALRYPSDADHLIRELSLAVSRLPQLLEQVAGWLAAEQSAGRIGMAGGSRLPSSSLALDVVRLKLDTAARGDAHRLWKALEAAASVTSDMEGTGG